LYVVAFVVGTFDVTFAVAYQALLVSIVRRRDYLAANSLLNGSRSLAQVIGLALGGALVGLLTAPGALVLNALSFVVSGTQLARIHPPEPAGDTSRSRGIAGGVRWIRSGWDERKAAIILISSHAEEDVEELVPDSPAAGFLASRLCQPTLSMP
jgi:hypothetical protein